VNSYNNNVSGYALYTNQGNASGYSIYAYGGKNYFSGNVGIGTTGPTHKLEAQRAAGAANEGEVKGLDGTQWWMINSNQAAGAYNPQVAAGDTALIYTKGSIDTGSLVIGPHSASSKGIRIDSAGYVHMPAGHGADIAENYQISGIVLRGSLMSVDNANAKTAVASSLTQSNLLGVISTKPGAVMDIDDGFNIGYATKPTYINEKAPIALVGLVPTLVTSQNGSVNIGDAIGISNIPGFGGKMITAGNIVGKALEKLDTNSCPTASSVDSIVWPEDDGKNSLRPCFLLPDGTYVGKIMVAVNPSWYDPDVYLTDSGDLKITATTSTSEESPSGPPVRGASKIPLN